MVDGGDGGARRRESRPVYKLPQKSPQYSSGGRYEQRYRESGHRSSYTPNKRMNEGVYREESPGVQRRRYNGSSPSGMPSGSRKSSHGQKQSMVVTGGNTTTTSYRSETISTYDATRARYHTRQTLDPLRKALTNDVRNALSLSLSVCVCVCAFLSVCTRDYVLH